MAGDAASYYFMALPKLNVFAIRQSPVLYHNLQAVLRGEPLRRYRPQKRFFYVLNLGDGTLVRRASFRRSRTASTAVSPLEHDASP